MARIEVMFRVRVRARVRFKMDFFMESWRGFFDCVLSTLRQVTKEHESLS